MLEFLEQNSIDYKVVFFFFSTQLIITTVGTFPLTLYSEKYLVLKSFWFKILQLHGENVANIFSAQKYPLCRLKAAQEILL